MRGKRRKEKSSFRTQKLSDPTNTQSHIDETNRELLQCSLLNTPIVVIDQNKILDLDLMLIKPLC